MKIRGWVNLFISLTLSSVYALLLIVLKLEGVILYGLIALGIGLLAFIIVLMYRSTDEQQLRIHIKKSRENPKNIYDEHPHILAIETSESPLNDVNYVLRQSCGKNELQQILDCVALWKKENNFKWTNETAYDELNIEAYANKEIYYQINHLKYTKTFQIKGVLKPSQPVLVKVSKYDSERVEKRAYEISGLKFSLANVQPDDEGRLALWSISIDERSKEVYTGIITAKEFL